VNGAVAFPGLANGEQAMADLKRGTYDIAITPAGTSTEVFNTALKVKPGRAYNAYAVGTPANGTFEVLLQVTPIGRHCDLSRGEGHD
jgi:hypothetical protein